MSALKELAECVRCDDRGWQWAALPDGEAIKEPCPDCFDRLVQDAEHGTPVGQTFRQAHSATWFLDFQAHAGHPLTPRQRVVVEHFLSFADKLAEAFKREHGQPPAVAA